MICLCRVIRMVRVAECRCAPARRQRFAVLLFLVALGAQTSLNAGGEQANMSLGVVAPKSSDLGLSSRGASNADALAHYSAALQFETAGRLRLALEHYLAVFKADPTNADLASHTASIAMQFQGREAAIEILEKAVVANPGSPEPLLNLARFSSTYPPEDLFAKDERALDAVNTALEKFPRHAAVYEAAVLLHLTQNRHADAVRVMGQAAGQSVTSPRYWLDVGLVAERVWPLGQTEFRQDHLARVTPFFETALKFVSKDNAEEITLEVARHFLMTNDVLRSQQLCEKLATEYDSLAARKLLFRMYEASQQPDKALDMLEQVVKQAPEDVEHQRLLARVFESRKESEKAIPHLQAAIQHGGGEIGDYVMLGWQFWQTRELEQMVRVGERTVRLFPDHPLVHYQLAIGYRGRDQFAKSVAHFAEAEQLATDNQAEMLDHTFYYQYGIALERLERDDEAARVLQKSIQLTPPDKAEMAANTMNFLGYMWLEKNIQLDKAEELIVRANEIAPDNPAYVDSLGWLHFKKGDFRKALAELQRAAGLLPEILPEDAEILEHIGLAHEQLGDKVKAREFLERAAALKTPDPEMRKRIEETLKRMSGADTKTK